MKHSPSRPSRHRLAVLAAACGLAVLAAPAAHAFTIDTQSNTNSNGSRALHRSRRALLRLRQRPDTIQQGNTTIRFGGQPQSFDQRYDPNRMFDPLARPGSDR